MLRISSARTITSTATTVALRLAVALSLLAVGSALSVVSVAGAPPAGPQARLVVTPDALGANGAATVTVSGQGYLVPPHAPGASVLGGVYVLFGWVAPGVPWGPSARNSTDANGQFGVTYAYAGESGSGETRDDGSGRNRFVAFTPGGIDADATPFHMDDGGNWSVTLTIPSPVFEWSDPGTGRRATVDCRVSQCGVLTLGAHGRASSTNEQFAPLRFAAPSGPATTAPPAQPAPGATGSGSSGAGSSGPTASGAGGSSPSAGGTPRGSAGTGIAPTTAPVAVAGETTVPGTPDTAASADPGSPSSVAPTPGADDRRRTTSSEDVAADRRDVIHLAAADSGLPPVLWAVPAAGGVLLAGAFVVRIRRSPSGHQHEGNLP